MRTITSIFYILFLATSVNAQKEYKFVNKLVNADFNYDALYSIDTFSNRREVFQPIKGSFTVYTFIATFKGLSHRDEQLHDFHDILIIKTDNGNLIKDAFQYTLEWAEMPLSYDLHQSKSSGILLSNKLSVNKLNLQRVQETDDSDKKSKEDGVIKLN